MERDRLVIFINKLILHHRNVRDIVDSGGVRTLVDLMTLAHLHITRAVIPTQTNVIEAGPGMQAVQEQEWFYNTEDKGRNGPVSFNEVCFMKKFNSTFVCFVLQQFDISIFFFS